MKAYILAGVVLLLAACVSPEARLARHVDSCAAYGFNAGTVEFAQCVQQEEMNRQERLYRRQQSRQAAREARAQQHRDIVDAWQAERDLERRIRRALLKYGD